MSDSPFEDVARASAKAAKDERDGARKYDWRAEMYGDESGQDPFWVSVEDEHGASRDAVEAAQLARGFVGSFDDGLSVELIRGRIESMGVEGYRFIKDEDGDLSFWEVCGG